MDESRQGARESARAGWRSFGRGPQAVVRLRDGEHHRLPAADDRVVPVPGTTWAPGGLVSTEIWEPCHN